MSSLIKYTLKVPGTKHLSQKVRTFMCDHCIGKKNAVPIATLFLMCVGKPNNFSNLQKFVILVRLRRVMNSLRKTKDFFIIPVKDKNTGEYMYCIPTTKNDLADYINIYERNKKNYQRQIRKGLKFVEDKKWKYLK